VSSPGARPEPQGTHPLSPGDLLRAAREQAGWTADRLAAELCLPVERLQALEEDEYDSFGGSVFVRGYLRRAAGLLGLPPQELIVAFERCCRAEQPAETRPGPVPGRLPRRGLPTWSAPLVGVLAVAAALGLTWWFLGAGPEETPTVEARGLQRLPALEFISPPQRPVTADPVVAPESAGKPADSIVAPGVAAAPVEVPLGAPDIPPQQDAAAQDEAPMPELRVVELPEPAGPPPGSVELRFEFSEDCWLEVTDAQERRLAYRLYRAGEVARMRGSAPVAVFLGNAEGVRLTVDDAPIAVRPAARRDGTARLTVGGGAG
jgi:cytoskeleton protein RodZ